MACGASTSQYGGYINMTQAQAATEVSIKSLYVVYIQLLTWHYTLRLGSTTINRSPEPTLKISTSCRANCSTATNAREARKSIVPARRTGESKELGEKYCRLRYVVLLTSVIWYRRR